jgi:hypothetical protein
MSTMWGASASTFITALLTAVVAPADAQLAKSPLVVETARGTYNAAFAWRTTATLSPDGGASSVHADGFPFARGLVPLVAVRLGERIRVRSLRPVDSLAVRYARRPPVSFGPVQTVSWRVPASGTYVVAITVASSTPAIRSTAEYVLRLRARRS